MKLYRDTETGEIITESELKAEFELLKAEDPDSYDYTFYQYIMTCTDKSGMLEEIV